jgi:hypothetical protein
MRIRVTENLVRDFWRDADGFLHASVVNGYELLGDYLVTDVGPVGGRRFGDAMRSADIGLSGGVADDMINNAYSVEVDGQTTTIEALYDEERVLVITTAQYKASLEAYQRYRETATQQS